MTFDSEEKGCHKQYIFNYSGKAQYYSKFSWPNRVYDNVVKQMQQRHSGRNIEKWELKGESIIIKRPAAAAAHGSVALG